MDKIKKYKKNFIIFFTIILFSLSINSIYAWDNSSGGDHSEEDWIPVNGTNISGNHFNIGTFTIPEGVIVYIDGYQKTSNGGNVTISASVINISGKLEASGRGFGGGGAGSNIQGSLSCVSGLGGVSGNGGNGADGKWSSCSPSASFGGGGGGSPGGIGGITGSSNGTFTLGGRGGNSCRGTGADGGTGFGGGGGGGAGCTAGGAGAGGGGSGGQNASNRTGGNGAGIYKGTGGAGTTTPTMNNATNAGYSGFAINNDTSLDVSLLMGSGGGGGGSTSNNGAAGGGGGGAGGGIVILNATTITITGNISSQGAGGGKGVQNTDTSEYSGFGGGGSGGGIGVFGCTVTLSGNFDNQGRLQDSLSTTNGGSLKIFYSTITDTSTNQTGRKYTSDNISAARECGKIVTIISPTNNQIYNSQINLINYSLSNDSLFDKCWWSNSSGNWNSSSVNPETYLFSGITSNEGSNNWSVYCNDTNGSVFSKSVSFTIDTTSPVINITYPLSTTYATALTELNYTHSETNTGYCWYSINSGATNSTPVSPGTNFTNFTSSGGSNTWIVYCNDSSNNINSDSVIFTSTIPVIGLEWIYPTLNINVSENQFFNISVNVSCSNNDCGEINVTLDPSVGTQYNFTNCNTSGKDGPSQANCNSSYSGTSLDGEVTILNGIQEWIVPSTGTYTFEAGGARGGHSSDEAAPTYQGGGLGAKIVGTFSLTAGDKLYILVGQRGDNSTTASRGGGGGGGSFIATGSNYTNSTPLLIAGGGGGTGEYAIVAAVHGQNGTDGGDGMQTTVASSGGAGGTNGSAGTRINYGGGGAGWKSDGQTCYSSATIPKNFTSGGVGGALYSGGADGGFGGGGGCYAGSGGGGGYSGGGGGEWSNGAAGGGGGSYNNGTEQNNTAGINTGQGYVIITYSGGAKSGTVSTNSTATPFYTNITNPYNLTLNQDESQIITWWVNATGSIDNAHEFFIYANKTSDLTNSNITSKLNITIKDITQPTINIIYPTNTTYNTTVENLTYTYSETNTGYCWYSTDSGATNSTPVSTGTNWTDLNSGGGTHTWRVYCNDSSNNINSDSITFTSSIPLISLTLLSPTTHINVTQNEFFEVQARVTCSNNDCGALNVTLDPEPIDDSQSNIKDSFDRFITQSAITLYDVKDFDYDIQDGCDLSDGEADVFDGGLRPYINNSEYTGTRSTTEDSGREAVCDPQTKSSLNITRKVYVPANENWARYLEILHNPTAGIVCVDYKISQNMGSDGSDYLNTSSGDTTWNTDDYWMMWDDTSPTTGDDAATFIYQEDGTSEPVDTVSPTTASGGANSWIWENVCVPAGDTKILMHFFTQWDTRAQSEAEANVISENFNNDTHISGMSDDEKSQVVNWQISATKSGGTVSTTPGTTPFYTNTTNPYNLTLNQDGTATISWWVNATGNVNTTHEFFIYVNQTADQTISDITEKWNVTILSNGTYSEAIDNTAPTINLISPINNSGQNPNIIFKFNTTDLNDINNCSLIFNGIINQTNTSITKDITQNFTINNLPISNYNWSINCTDSYNNQQASTTNFFSIIQRNEFPGQTTNLSEIDTTNITNLIIDNPNQGLINFTNTVDLSSGADINSYVNISFNRIEIDSTLLPSLNQPARLKLYNLTFTTPQILKDGSVCSDCTQESYVNGTLIFNVTGFSVYSSRETTTSSSTTTTTGGGGGSSSKKTNITKCEKDSDCQEDYSCYNKECVKLFDVEIKSINPLIEHLNFELTYLVKGMAEINSDVIIKFWIEKNNKKIELGQDTIYLASFEEKTKTTTLNLPYETEDGNYDLYVESGYENYKAQSFRKINIRVPEETRIEEKIDTELQVIKPSNTFYLWLIIFLLILITMLLLIKRTRIPIIAGLIYLKHKIKEPSLEISFDDLQDEENIKELEIEKQEVKELQKQNKTNNLPIYQSQILTPNQINKQEKFKSTINITSLSKKKVYTESGNLIGTIRKAILSKTKIHSWIIKPDKKYNLKKDIKIKHKYVKEIKRIFIIDQGIEHRLKEIKSNTNPITKGANNNQNKNQKNNYPLNNKTTIEYLQDFRNKFKK
ncbi:hypothetical protein HOD75_01700 [archaeon]|jgi:sporulation protein YlmC with PRC-barrel domain|nr:hypothetical protein [archaeon]MBT4241591.1 hypothetical protein [archaeon]MBT4417986.1 hypothetical protein [archaeon]